MSFLKNLDELVNTAPVLVDPEDDVHEDSKARLVDRFAADYDNAAEPKPKPRRRPEPIFGEHYVGKKISRKDLDEDGFDTDDDDLQDDDDDDDDGDDDGNRDSIVGTDVGDSKGNEDDALMREHDVSSAEDSAGEEEIDEEDESDEDDEDGESGDAGPSSMGQSAEVDGVDQFSSVDVAAEVKKGKAVHSQLLIWDSILELRIQLQKLLVLANQFPKQDRYPLFRAAALEEDKKNGNLINQASKSLEYVMNQLLTLQEQLRDSYPEIRSLFSTGGGKESPEDEIDSEDEEIPSDTEEEEEAGEEGDGQVAATTAKRKHPNQGHPKKPSKFRKMDACVAAAAEFWKKFEPYRNSTIDKWYERTRLLSGKVGRGFASLEQSPVKQIEHILIDEERLLRRTQTKRTSYKILGSEVAADGEEQQPGAPEVDPEIFDDDDFYHHLLREIIERKTSNVDNPVALSRQWLEIQKLRSKVKRKVDTRASKGRKIRYDIIPKLVNYMAPLDMSTYSEEAKTELFGSLFGQKKYAGPSAA